MTNEETHSSPALLIFYDYFYPGYKAGGPIQSLINLVIKLESHYMISVITSAFDMQSNTSYNCIQTDAWSSIILPGSTLPIDIWYAKKKLLTKKLAEIIRQKKPEVIYLNGIFSYRFFLLPLIAINKLNYQTKVIICPRGMLQQGALSGKHLKKKLYVTALQFTGLLKKKSWHATNEQEERDIKKVFGQYEQVTIASNIPKKPLSTIHLPSKQKGKLRLIYLSLIAGKKNLLFALELIQQCGNVSLDIYGPVKDVTYWKECKKLMFQMPGKVRYMGEVIPAEVQKTFSQYDASILLTKGENFGHALYECLSVGRPIITSQFTPWVNLQEQNAGWNISITSTADEALFLHSLSDMPSDEFANYCIGAYQLALNYYSGLDSVAEYKQLFQ